MTHALIIDDEKSNLDVMGQMLQLAKMDYTAVQDPNSVGAVLEEGTHFDIILLDLEMPDLNGYDVFSMIQDQPHLQGVPVVACSVHTNEINTVRELGFDSFIMKPLDVDNFADQITQVLSGRAIWQAY